MSEATKQEELLSFSESPSVYSTTTTEVNITGSWRFLRPVLEDNTAPCSAECPSSINMARYMRYLGEGDLKAAVSILREENPIPAIIGRVCPAFCQLKCNRGEFDEHIAIRQIERTLGDYWLDNPDDPPEITKTEKIAVVGAGPAGISCAYFLAKFGYEVTIYEKNEKIGGVLTYGIPPYRLPADIRDRELALVTRGINLKTDFNIAEKELYKMTEKYDAVFFAPGLWKDRIVLDGMGVYAGGEILKEIAEGKRLPEGKKAVVVGAGNVAMDVARSLQRLGKDVLIVCAETAEQMPAFDEEIEQAIEEGIKIKHKELPVELIYEDASAIKLSKIRMSKAHIEGRRVVIDKAPAGFIQTDLLVYAIGQEATYRAKELPNLFTGGDYETGPGSVTAAVASGKAASFLIREYLKTGKLKKQKPDNFRAGKTTGEKIIGFDNINSFYFKKKKRVKWPVLPVGKRADNFDEIIGSYEFSQAIEEAGRCFHCGSCDFCQTCWFFCPDVAIKTTSGEIFIDLDYCKGCGICSSECPRGVIAMKEEP